MSNNKIIRVPQVIKNTGYARSTLYLRISQGLWPKPVKLGARAVGWPESEVIAINSALIAGFDDDKIKALVEQLEQTRKHFIENSECTEVREILSSN